MPVVTQLSSPRRQPNRRRIYLDGVFAFACNLNVVARFRLREGMALSDEQVLSIQRGEVRQECFDKAMKSLQSRLHSRAELFKKLMRGEYGATLIDDVLDQLTGLGYINDEQFAKTRALSAARHKHYGPRRAKIELLKSGIVGDLADRAIDDVYDKSDITLTARNLVQKQLPRLRKLDPAVARRRLTGMLLRRGFDYETIKPVVDQALGPQDDRVLADE